MRTDLYTSPLSFRRPLNWSKFISKHVEPMLLSMLILTGAIGSFYVFGLNFLRSDQAFATLSDNIDKGAANAMYAPNSANAFDEYVTLEEPIVAGKSFKITFLQDNTADRYIIEMGDGMRMSVTNTNLMYTYELKGKYVMELKVLKDGLFQMIGTKKIKVK